MGKLEGERFIMLTGTIFFSGSYFDCNFKKSSRLLWKIVWISIKQ